MGALKNFERREIDRILDKCTTCGKCFEVCPMVEFGDGFSGDGASQKVLGILDILRGKKGTPDALQWAGLCTECSVCVPLCPASVDPMLMLRLSRMVALGGLGGVNQYRIRHDPNYYRRIWAFARLQLTEDEVTKWT